MDSQDIDRAENLRRVYEQNWLHARHVENERLWFTNIYAVIMAASLALMSDKGPIWPLATFLLILSFLGFFMCHALRKPFIRHSRTCEIISRREWHLMDYSGFFPRMKQPKDKLEKGGEVRKGIFSLSEVFYFFYILGTSISAILLMQATDWPLIVQIVLVAFVFGALLFFRYYVFKKAEQRIHDEMGEIDREA